MKLYTEEQVRKAIKVASKLIWAEGDILAKLTPIEIPSDEEIEEKFTAACGALSSISWDKRKDIEIGDKQRSYKDLTFNYCEECGDVTNVDLY